MDEEVLAAKLQVRIRTRRLHLNLTQDEVASRAQISIRRYQEFEGAAGPLRRFNPTLRTLLRLAHALNLELSDLLYFDEPH